MALHYQINKHHAGTNRAGTPKPDIYKKQDKLGLLLLFPRGHSATLWAAGGHLAVETVGISVWWSDFSILRAFCKETQPYNLLAKNLEQFHEAPANI